jgi:hypothetical protein
MMHRYRVTLRMGMLITVIGLVLAALGVPKTALSQEGLVYEVMVTNLTRGQQFTPILVATHSDTVKLFTLGSPSTPELAILAEEGNTAPLAGLLMATPGVRDVRTSSGLLNPGASTSVTVQASGSADHYSLAAMLIPTNDGFVALNTVELPTGNRELTVFSVAYDAGSERNDELCASIPGPFFAECGGPGGGGMPGGGEERYVHIHAGIHGIGNLSTAMRDWRNPVAKITIRRVR